ncbi:MAG: hypothetical protein ACOZAP_02330 [Pseudomonadota bacterium]|jgi:hypothetical protein
MPQLSKTLAAWGTPAFNDVLKDEVRQLGVEHLPLQQGLAHGNFTSGENLQVRAISTSETFDAIEVKAGLFYSSIIAGCACVDDPTPLSDLPEYSEVLIRIDKATAEATITLLTA